MAQNVPGVMVGYCDDTSNVVAGDTADEVRENCEVSIRLMRDYANKMGLSLNLTKTEILFFGKNPLGDVKVDDITIKESPEAKFLGVWIGKTRSHKTHTDKLMTKLNQKIGILRRLSKNLPCDMLKTIAKSTVGGSIYASAISAFDPIYKAGSKQIDRLQRALNASARVVLRKPRNDRTSSEELMDKLGCDTVRKTITLKLFRSAWNIYAETGSMKYLAGLWGDDKVANRARRGLNRTRLPEYMEGRSLTCKARAAWNVLDEAGLSSLKRCEDENSFARQCRKNYSLISSAIERRWAG